MRQFLLIIFILVAYQPLFAQERIVQGVVADENGEPLPWATVLIQGTKKGTTTGIDGNYTLKIDNPADSLMLCFSFVGYETKCALVPATNKLSVYLLPSAELGLGEVVIEANRIIENFSATQVMPIRAADIKRANTATTADLLENSGQIFVQRSQQGGGSPVLRGFEANRILIMVDGMRINNAIFRSGHLQNVITIDQNLLEGADVYFGANSLSYGSDALGGVVNFKTKQPNQFQGISGNLAFRYSSASNERMTHFDASYGKGKLAALTSLTFSKFDELKSGKNTNPFNSYKWLRDSVTTRTNGQDVIIKNSNAYKQAPNGYGQWNLSQKIKLQSSESTTHLLNFMYTTSSDVPRYERLAEDANGNFTNTNFRSAEWYYGPQKRLSASYTLNVDKDEQEDCVWDMLQLIVFYQNMEESRIDRRFGDNRRRHQEEEVNSLGTKLDLQIHPSWGRIQGGIEIYFDDVKSSAYRENILTGERTNTGSRYPDKGSQMLNYGFYTSFIKELSATWQLSAGTRYSFAGLKASAEPNASLANFAISKVEQRNSALTGSINLTKKLGKFNLNTLFSSAFRAPNVDDVGKVFEAPSASVIVVPNPDLEPELAYNYELAGIWRSRQWSWQVSLFHTWLKDAIQQGNFQVNGQNTLTIDGQDFGVVSNTNVGNGRIYGLFANLNYTPQALPLHLDFSMTYTKGKSSIAGEPLGHISPLFGKFSARYEHKKAKLNQTFFLQFNGQKDLADFANSTNDRKSYFEGAGESPAWYTLNYRLDWQVHEKIRFQFGVDNILDTHYRIFASGINAPGRNFILAVRGSF